MSHLEPRTKFVPASLFQERTDLIESLAQEMATETGLRVVVVDASGQPLVEMAPPHGAEPSPPAEDLWGALRGTVEISEGTDLTRETGEDWKADA